MHTPPAQHVHDDGAGGEGQTFAPDLHDIRHLWLKAVLLAAWVLSSFGACYFARDLQALMPDWPLAYWFAAQGAVLMFLLIVVVYCLSMDHFERRDARDSESHALRPPRRNG
jgi:putative solute:sodium symporter small subunit